MVQMYCVPYSCSPQNHLNFLHNPIVYGVAHLLYGVALVLVGKHDKMNYSRNTLLKTANQ